MIVEIMYNFLKEQHTVDLFHFVYRVEYPVIVGNLLSFFVALATTYQNKAWILLKILFIVVNVIFYLIKTE